MYGVSASVPREVVAQVCGLHIYCLQCTHSGLGRIFSALLSFQDSLQGACMPESVPITEFVYRCSCRRVKHNLH